MYELHVRHTQMRLRLIPGFERWTAEGESNANDGDAVH
jgi:hypothetical protein